MKLINAPLSGILHNIDNIIKMPLDLPILLIDLRSFLVLTGIKFGLDSGTFLFQIHLTRAHVLPIQPNLIV